MNSFYPSIAFASKFYVQAARLVSKIRFVLLLVLGLTMYKMSAAQTTLAAGDLAFSAYDATPTVADDKFSFILLTNVSAGTEIYFTDRGYTSSGWQGANSNTEGGIKWVTGTALPLGTEVMIKSLSATVNGSSNGTVTTTTGANPLGLSLSHPSGDQIIAFQGGGGNPAGAGVTFIAGLHWNYCPIGYYDVYNTDAGWDNIGTSGSCILGPNSSNLPPGLTGGVNAFWIGFYKPVAPARDICNYTKGQFNGAGAPFSSAAALRAAMMNRDNWIPVKSTDNTTTINVPSSTSQTYISTASVATLTTSAASEIASSSAKLGGNISADGGAGVTERGIVWATTTNPTTTNNKTTMGTGTGSFSNTVGSLPAGTLIYFRAYAINSAGTSYGSNASFTTAAAGVLLSTNPVISFSNNSGFSDNVASDGEGGSTAISDFDINVLPINSSGIKLTQDPLQYHDNNDWRGYPAIITYGAEKSLYGWSIRSGNGAEFNFKGISAHDWGDWEGGRSTTFILEAFRDNVSLGSVTFAGNSDGSYVELTEGEPLTAVFKNVDEVRMYKQGGTNSYLSLNHVHVGVATAAPPPTISTHPDNRTICASRNTTFSITATNSTGYQWQVNNGEGFGNITNGGVYSGATTSTLTLTEVSATMSGYQYRCIASGAGTATSNTATLTISSIKATTSQVDVSCFGGSNGSAAVVPSGGISPYTYSWSPSGGTAASATGLVAGAYTVTITDNMTCTTTKSFTITQPSALAINTSSQTNVSCNSGTNGSASVTPTGGTGAYTYSWSPSGGTAATATGLAVGTYTVTVTDANSCTATKSFTITQPTAIVLTSALQSNVSCNGGSNGVAKVSATGGTGSYTYSWSPSGGTAATATGLAAGAYTVTVTDANSCTATKSFTISQPTAMTVSADVTNVSCNGGSNGAATVTASGGTGGLSYSWSPSGGTAATATGLAAGTYTVTITDANECSVTKSVTITEPAPITMSATPASETLCSGGQTDIALTSSAPGASFNWTVSVVSGNVSGATASSGSSIQQTLTGNGVVKYTITPGDGVCTAVAKSVQVIVHALTTIEMHPADKMVDEEETAKFSVEANNTSSYQWQVNAGSGFANISNDEHYSGATRAVLEISDALGSMNGYLYRCVATGNCTPVYSDNATLTVRVRTPQTISFASTDVKVYGQADFVPAATSDAGLDISYISSDESVATIVNGKIHIKKAGQVTITASQAGNYSYKPAADALQVLTISPKPVTVSLSANPTISKVYDSYTTIKLDKDNYALNGIVEGDEVSVKGSALFEDNKAGDNKTIQVSAFILGGEQADNYQIVTSSAEVKGAITRKAIEVSLQASPLISKIYNGSDKASLAGANYMLGGILGEDEVTVVSGKTSYDNKNAGYDKVITATEFVLGGAQKDNYALTTTSANTSGDIKTKEITLSLATAPSISKTYDGSVSATVPSEKYQLEGIETGDDVSVKGNAVYNSRQAGEHKKVTVNAFVLEGEDHKNYHLTTTELTGSGVIGKATLTIALIDDTTPVTKEYDGTTAATLAGGNYSVAGIVGEDDVLLNNPANGVYDNKHGGAEKKVTVSGLEISGEDASNYILESTTVSGNVGKITRKVIGIKAAAQTKIYGQADPELGYDAAGKLEEDQLTGSLQRTEGKNVGAYEILQGSLSGGDDYLIEWFEGASFTITPASLTITAEDKTKKQGAANPVLTFSFSGLAEGDQASDLEIQPTAATSATAGSPIGYYEIQASGAASPNYTISYVKGKLTVTPGSGDNYSVKVWSSSPDVLQVRIFTTEAQKGAITLFTETGQKVIIQVHQLNVGINSFSVPVGHLASSTYVLAVTAEKFKDAQKVKVK